MGSKELAQVKKAMPDYLKVKVNRVAKDRKISFDDAIIFLVKKGINA